MGSQPAPCQRVPGGGGFPAAHPATRDKPVNARLALLGAGGSPHWADSVLCRDFFSVSSLAFSSISFAFPSLTAQPCAARPSPPSLPTRVHAGLLGAAHCGPAVALQCPGFETTLSLSQSHVLITPPHPHQKGTNMYVPANVGFVQMFIFSYPEPSLV